MAYNILVVDDSGVMRKMIIRTLNLCGLPIGEIHEAGNGQEGLAVLGGKKIDIALVDINMPVMGGDEMVDQLRKNPDTEKLPVIFVSSESSSARIELLMKKGTGFVHKPFAPDALRDNILSIIGGDNGTTA